MRRQNCGLQPFKFSPRRPPLRRPPGGGPGVPIILASRRSESRAAGSHYGVTESESPSGSGYFKSVVG
eukprot:515304-Hanusia_phi.AAC.1